MKTAVCGVIALIAGSAAAQPILDGSLTDSVWGSPLAVQDTATQFGDATGGGQDSAGGSELNAAYGYIDGGILYLGLTGNLEGNFNKMWIFIDAVAGGENTLAGDNVDGGFNEINSLGYTFDAAFEPDHGIRLEVGGGFLGIRGFDLIDNTGGDIWTAGGTGDLPLSTGVGGFGVQTGWDNSNTLGVTGSDASGALSATTGIEFAIDMAAFFGATPGSVKVMAVISNDNGGFTSNQVLGGVGGANNLGGAPNFENIAGDQFFTVIPAPASVALLGLGGVAALRRRR